MGRASRALLALVAGIAGCAAPGEPGELSLLVSRITLPAPRPGAEAVGLDLDGQDTGAGDPLGARCDRRDVDLASALDPAERGVDDVAGLLAPSVEGLVGRTFDAELEDAITGGRLAIAIVLRDLPPDGEGPVEVEILSVEPLMGIFDHADGRLAPDQLVRGRLVARGQGTLSGGTVRARFESLSLPVAGEPIPMLPLDDLGTGALQLAIEVTPNGARARGVLGAGLPVAALLDEVARLDPDWVQLATSLLGRWADLSPSASDPCRCERVSIGLRLEAVEVTVVP